MLRRQRFAHEPYRFGDEGINGLRADDLPLIEGMGGEHVTAGSSAQPHVDTITEERCEGRKPFRHLQGPVVHGHHSARPKPDRLRRRRDARHEQIWRTRQEVVGVVVLGQPEPVETDLLKFLCQGDGLVKGLGDVMSDKQRNLLQGAQFQRSRPFSSGGPAMCPHWPSSSVRKLSAQTSIVLSKT